MLIRCGSDIPSSEITPEPFYRNRRFHQGITGAMLLPAASAARWNGSSGRKLLTRPARDAVEYATTYNNAGRHKQERSVAIRENSSPAVDFCRGPRQEVAVYDLDALIKGLTRGECVCRMRCVRGGPGIQRGFPGGIGQSFGTAPSLASWSSRPSVAGSDAQAADHSGGNLNWPPRRSSVGRGESAHAVCDGSTTSLFRIRMARHGGS
jgi:hypothetical protein